MLNRYLRALTGTDLCARKCHCERPELQICFSLMKFFPLKMQQFASDLNFL